MSCESNTYHKVGEIYFAKGKNYSIFCLYCNELFYDFAKFKLHSKIHLNETKTIEKENISSDLKIDVTLDNNDINLENQTDISYNCLELKEELEIQTLPDSTENNTITEINTDEILDEDFSEHLDEDFSESLDEDLNEHLDEPIDEDLEEHVNEVKDQHLDDQDENSDEIDNLIEKEIKKKMADVYCIVAQINTDEILDEELNEHLDELIDEDLDEHVNEVQDDHLDDQDENSDEIDNLIEIEIKKEIADVYCSFCKLSYKLNSHNSEKCSQVQEAINKCNGDFIKLLKQGVLCCLKCRRYFEDYKSLYEHHKEAKHCIDNAKCKICKLYNFMNLKLTAKNITVTKNNEETPKEKKNQKESEDQNSVDFFDESLSNKTEEYPFKCSFCDKVFRLRNQMNTHIRVHTNNRPYKCQFCPSAFTVSANLKNHIVYKHTEEKPFVCNYENCNKRFKLMDLKKQHEKRHLPASFQCELCGKYFKARIYLLLHQRNVHEDPNTWKFQCDFCNKKFARSTRLTEHKRMHTGEKPFSCDICDKVFSKRSTLRQHKKLHSDEKQYVCKFCSKGFKQSAGYWGHMKRHRDPN